MADLHGAVNPEGRAVSALTAYEWVAATPTAAKPLVLPVEPEPLREPGPMPMLDAAYECEHGRLPHDRVEQRDPCGCWLHGPRITIPRVSTPATTSEEAKALTANPRLESRDIAPGDDLEPALDEGLARRVIEQINAEIQRLRETRARVIEEVRANGR